MRDVSRRTFLAGGAALPLCGCGIFPDHRIRYALTVKLQVGSMTRAGTNVMEARYFMNHILVGFDGIGRYTSRASANAIVIEMGERGTLFALLNGAQGKYGFVADHPEYIVGHNYPEYQLGKADDMLETCSHFPEDMPVGDQYLPVLLWMKDKRKPNTARFLTFENSEVLLGSRLQSVEASMAISDAPITRGLEKQLPWWNDTPNGSSRDSVFAIGLRQRNFVMS